MRESDTSPHCFSPYVLIPRNTKLSSAAVNEAILFLKVVLCFAVHGGTNELPNVSLGSVKFVDKSSAPGRRSLSKGIPHEENKYSQASRF